MKRSIAMSVQPAKYPWIAPYRMPITAHTALTRSANTTERRKPYSSRASRSRPRSSLPNTFSPLGFAGLGSEAK